MKKETKKFNENVLAGLVGGLLVVLSQIAYEEIIELLGVQDNYIFKIFLILLIAVLIFVIFSSFNLLIMKKAGFKKGEELEAEARKGEIKLKKR